MIRIFFAIAIISIISFVQSAEPVNTKKERKHLNSINLPFLCIQDDQCKKYLNKITKQRKKQFNQLQKREHITPIS